MFFTLSDMLRKGKEFLYNKPLKVVTENVTTFVETCET